MQWGRPGGRPGGRPEGSPRGRQSPRGRPESLDLRLGHAFGPTQPSGVDSGVQQTVDGVLGLSWRAAPGSSKNLSLVA